ncbi:hypothetical protein CVT26_014409 [Gymnopilus dilepis]|uniref:Uncharacterized protein n=1 Tax=Gymnopilus dilepis TaxID=231916 RepID=A0A409Y7D3_9AGAR|nr:hypothetical protein CVT26_014409 [Gymnopilus dilepis]
MIVQDFFLSLYSSPVRARHAASPDRDHVRPLGLLLPAWRLSAYKKESKLITNHHLIDRTQPCRRKLKPLVQTNPGGDVGEKHTGAGKNVETSNTGPTSTNSAPTSQPQATEASNEETKPSGDPPADILAHSKAEQDADEDEEEDEDESAPQFTWGFVEINPSSSVTNLFSRRAPRGRLAPPVKGKPPHPR